MLSRLYAYTPLPLDLESGSGDEKKRNNSNNKEEAKTSTQITEKIQLQAVKVVIALQLFIKLNQRDLFDNVIVKTAELIPLFKSIPDQTTQLLTTYYGIDTSISEQKSLEYSYRFTQLKRLFVQNNLSTNPKFTKPGTQEIFNTIHFSSLPIFEILVSIFKISSAPNIEAPEEEDLLEFYYDQQILRQKKEYSVEGYLYKDLMYENLDAAIFKMIQQNRNNLVQDLLKHRMLLAAYLLNNRSSSELVETLSLSTARVINIFASDPSDAKNINEAVDDYYAECVTSNAALSADSTGNRIIKSVAAIAVGLLFCALVLCVAWLISYFWAGIVLLDISWKIQTGIAVTAACSLAMSGFFSFNKLRDKGYLDSEINQSTKTIADNMRQIASGLNTT